MKIVIVWASNDREKYGNKILRDLVKKWHIVIPVNPKENEIEWLKVYKSLSDIKLDFDIVNFVVKPEITLQILQKNLEIIKDKTIWCQPWASNEEVEIFLKNNFKNSITNSCIMIEDITKKD